VIKKIEILLRWLSENKISYLKNFELKKESWLEAGGIIKTFIRPSDEESCQNLIKFLKKNQIDFYILGNISNVIIRDGLIETPIINLYKCNKIFKKELENGLELKVNGGVSMPRLSKLLINEGITGNEGLVGIPGTVGGGIYMNASSYNSCISDYLTSVEFFEIDGNKKTLKKHELNFGFRKSFFQNKKYLIFNACFFYPKTIFKDIEFTKKKLKVFVLHRSSYQEKILPNLGSIFATYNLYKDLRKKNFIFNFYYIVYKIFSIIFHNFFRNYLLKFIKIVVRVYFKLLKLNLSSNFSLSDRTINCLINKGSKSGDEAIKFVKEMEIAVNKHARLENIILDKIK